MAIVKRDGDDNDDLKKTVLLDDYEQEIVMRALREHKALVNGNLEHMVEMGADYQGPDDWRNNPEIHAEEEWFDRTAALIKRLKKEWA